jgi:hypothetical protein
MPAEISTEQLLPKLGSHLISNSSPGNPNNLPDPINFPDPPTARLFRLIGLGMIVTDIGLNLVRFEREKYHFQHDQTDRPDRQIRCIRRGAVRHLYGPRQHSAFTGGPVKISSKPARDFGRFSDVRARNE